MHKIRWFVFTNHEIMGLLLGPSAIIFGLAPLFISAKIIHTNSKYSTIYESNVPQKADSYTASLKIQ